MNVMTVTDVPADATIKIQRNEEVSVQGFASELNRASSRGGNAKDVQKSMKTDKKAQADCPETKKTDGKKEDQPEEQKNVCGMPAIPVIINTQNQEIPAEAMQAAAQDTPIQLAQNAGGGVPANTAPADAQGFAQSAMQDVMTAADTASVKTQNIRQNAAQSFSAGVEVQATAQNTAGETGKTQNEPLSQGAQRTAYNNTAAAGQQALAPQKDAEAFAGQALREISDLQKAPGNAAAQTRQMPAEETLSAMQQTAQATQAVKTIRQEQQTVQPDGNMQQKDGQQTGQNMAAGEAQAEAHAVKQQAGGETRRNAQDGAAKESGLTQMQATFDTSAAAKTEFQQTVQTREQPAVRQTVMTTIIDTISTAFGKKTTEMVVQLKPEHLGGLSISLSMGESGLVAKMVTGEQSVHNMIHGEIGMLQEALREKGILVVHMEVSYGQTTNTSTSNQGGNGGYWTTPSYTGNQAAYDTEEPVNYFYNLSSYDLLTEQGGSVEFSA